MRGNYVAAGLLMAAMIAGCKNSESPAARPQDPAAATPTATAEATPAATPVASPSPEAAMTPEPTPEWPEASPTPMVDQELQSVKAKTGDTWQAVVETASGKPVLNVIGIVVTRNPGVVLALNPAGEQGGPATLRLQLSMTQREGFWTQVMKSRTVMYRCEECGGVQNVVVTYPDGESVAMPVNRR